MELPEKIKHLFLHSLRSWTDRSLPAASPREEHLVEELRKTFKEIGPPSETSDGEVEPFWDKQRLMLHELVAEDDPREFLRWKPIESTMCVGDYPYVVEELRYLQRQRDWTSRWQEALRESIAGRPRKFAWHAQSSGTLIHHAYHLCRFEEATGIRPNQLSTIVEFGGGYGGMCRLTHRLGFVGEYVIFDLPELSALQEFFLDLVNHHRPEPNGNSRPRATLITDLNRLHEIVNTQIGPALFIGTWSVSEAPTELRNKVMDMASLFEGVLIAYQEEFGGVNNTRFFSEWSDKHSQKFESKDFRIRHLPGNRYLMARRGEGGRSK